MWIARDKDNSLWLYNEKPIRQENEEDWTISSPTEEGIGELPFTMFPELKWEDEPIEVDLLLKGKTNKTDITVTRENIIFNDSYWTALRNEAATVAMQAILERWGNISLKTIFDDVVDLSIACANTLIKKLKSKDIKI